jgi:hypothetical protein
MSDQPLPKYRARKPSNAAVEAYGVDRLLEERWANACWRRAMSVAGDGTCARSIISVNART